VASHGNSWKQLFFERHLQDVLEGWDTATGDLLELRRLMAFSRRFVQSLHIRQLPSHLDLQLLFDCMVKWAPCCYRPAAPAAHAGASPLALAEQCSCGSAQPAAPAAAQRAAAAPCLPPLPPPRSTPATLSVCYTTKGVGMDYDRGLFGMKLTDCRCLAQALTRCETLAVLSLQGNALDDDKVRMLASGLLDNISITHLDLSHNKVGARRTAPGGAVADRLRRAGRGRARMLGLILAAAAAAAPAPAAADQRQGRPRAGQGAGRAQLRRHHPQPGQQPGARRRRAGAGARAAQQPVADLAQPAPQQVRRLQDLKLSSRSPCRWSLRHPEPAVPPRRLGEDGCVALAEALQGNVLLESLSLAANAATPRAGEALAAALAGNACLRELDVSCNALGEAAGAALRAAVEGCASLRGVDVRSCGLRPEDEEMVAAAVLGRQDRLDRERLLGLQGSAGQ
jgi:hypothetical protein